MNALARSRAFSPLAHFRGCTGTVRTTLALFFLLSFSSVLEAQVTGSISGYVRDPSAAVFLVLTSQRPRHSNNSPGWQTNQEGFL